VSFRRDPNNRVNGFRRSPAVTIRWATPADADKLDVLAELDDACVPPAPILLAFVGDELWVAQSLRTGALISDPFRPAAEVASLVSQRGRQLSAAS